MRSDLDSTAACQNGLVRKSWRAFNRAFGALNRWRKRYLWIRLLFMLLFAAYVCREAFFPVTARLVWMGAETILAAEEPQACGIRLHTAIPSARAGTESTIAALSRSLPAEARGD